MIEISTAYKRHRFPARLIAYAVWLYFRFPLSLRLVEELLLERGIVVSYESIRRWAAKFGPAIAGGIRRRAPRPGDVWHLDEMRVVIRGDVHWLWRAVEISTASCSTRSCSAAGTSGRPRGCWSVC
jgi:putative transposase